VSAPADTVTTSRSSWSLTVALYGAFAAAVLFAAAGRPLVAVGILGLAAFVAYLRVWLAWRTVLTVLLLSIMLLPANLYSLPISLPFDVEIYRLIVFALFLMWGVALMTDPTVKWRRTPLDLPLALVALAVGLSFVGNMGVFEPGLEFGQSLKGLIYVYTFLLMFYAIVSIVRDNETAGRLVRLMVYTATGLAVFAMVERITGYNLFRHLHEFIPVLEPSAEDIGFSVVRGGLRVSGSASHPIAFGTLLALVVPFPAELLLESKTSRERAKWGLLTIVIMIGMLLTVSRTAFIGLMAAVVVLAITRPRQRGLLVVSGMLATVALHMLFPGVIGRFIDNLNPTNVVARELSTQESRLAETAAAARAPRHWRR